METMRNAIDKTRILDTTRIARHEYPLRLDALSLGGPKQPIELVVRHVARREGVPGRRRHVVAGGGNAEAAELHLIEGVDRDPA